MAKYVDQDWPMGASQEDLDRDIRATVLDPETEIYVYGYYRTEPPRLQWGFLNPQTGIVECMNWQELERLVRKYYGYVADLEGSGVEALDLLFVRDKIQAILDASGPEEQIPTSIFEQIHDLDQALWAESETLCAVIGDRELQHARRQQRSPRSHWWWYLDGLKVSSQAAPKSHSQYLRAFVPA